MEVDTVDTIHSYGDKPDSQEIENSIKAAQENGLELVKTDCYGANHQPGEVVHVVILYFEEVAEGL